MKIEYNNDRHRFRARPYEIEAQALPDDLLLKIFDMLELQDLNRMLGVNRRWRDAALTESLWKSNRIKMTNLDCCDHPLLSSFPRNPVSKISLRDLMMHVLSVCDKTGGSVTVLSFVGGWCYADLKEISRAAIISGIHGVEIVSYMPYYGRIMYSAIEKEHIRCMKEAMHIAADCTVILTDHHISSVEETHLDAAQEKVNALGLRLPQALVLMTIILFARIMGRDPKKDNYSYWHNTFCAEEISDKFQVAVGGGPNHISVSSAYKLPGWYTYPRVGGQKDFSLGMR